MSFGSFLKGVVAQVLPGGGTYGSYNPKKKKQDDQSNTPGFRYNTVNPAQNNIAQQSQQQLKTQRPENLFQGLNQNMALPSAPKTNIPINSPNLDITSHQPLLPGTVIKPTPPKPQAVAPQKGYEIPQGVTGTRGTKNGQTGTFSTNKVTGQPHFIPDAPKAQDNRFWQKVGRGFKTAGQTAVGTVANVPEVALATGRAATGIVGGVTQIPHIATAGAATVTQKLANATDVPFTRQLNRGFQDLNTGTKNVTTVVNKPLDVVNRGLDRAAQGYENHVPMAAGGTEAYHATQIPINILAALLTGGSSAAGDAGEGANAAGKLAMLKNFLNKPLTSNADNVVARSSQAISGRTAPVVHALNTPFSTGKNAVGGIINKFRPNAAEGDLIDAGEVGNVVNGVEDIAGPQTTQIPVSQPRPITVTGTPGEPVTVPVVNKTPVGTPIRELSGDTPGAVRIPTADEIAAQRAASRFSAQPLARPDTTVEGIKPATPTTPYKLTADSVKTAQDDVVSQYASMLKDMGEGNGTQLVPDGEGGYTRTSNNFRSAANKGKKMTKQDWIDEAQQQLQSGKAEPGLQKAFDDASNPEVQSLLTKGDQTAEPPVGRPITVKQVTGIPVVDKTVVPQGLPETPGTLRPTTATAPANAKAEAVAAQTPPSLPIPKAGTTLSDGTKVTKRMVAAARNQSKLAKAKAKADESTAAALDRSLSAKPTSDKGFVQTGEYTKGRRGNVTQVTHKGSEAAQGAHDTANLSVQDVLDQARQEVNDNGVVSPETTRNLKAVRDSGRFAKTSPEFKAVSEEYSNAISHHARALSMTDRTARTTSTGDQLTNRFINKITAFADNSGKLTDAHIKQVTDAETAFTEARDAANAAGEQFKATGSQTDFEAWKSAQQVAEKADRQAKITEFNVSKDVLKGNKSIEATKAVQEAEKNAGVYSMDSIDANMLSGTGTMVRNYINTLFPRAENKLFGRLSSRLVKPIATVGGSSGRGARVGSKIGNDLYKADIAARKEAGVGRIRRIVTAGNTVGERNIQATAHSKAFDHYQQVLKKEGYTGAELKNRAEFNVRTDPDGLVAQYEKDALQANALSSLTHSKKIENVLADGIQKKLAEAGVGAKGQNAGRFGAKAVTRVGVGFPTVIAKSLYEGLKRATLGVPEMIGSSVKYKLTGNKEQYAAELSKAIQHAGSGGGMILLGHELGKLGVISGAYPTDPAERARWQAEGRQENSINIGGQWFNIPGYLGGFALPLMLGATTAQGNLKDEASLKNAWSSVLAASPVDSIQSTLDIMTGNSSDAKTKNAATSLVRAATPAGSFLAELAKLTDSTQNDTSTKDTLHNILDNIAGGIPGLNNKVNKIDKTDTNGNVLHNPNRVATVLGAQGSEQKQGIEDVKTAQTGANDTLQQLTDAGVVGNKSLMGLVDPKLAKKISSGQSLTPEEVTKVQKSVTKGVSATDDNNWREAGDYDTDKAALSAKLQMLDADPTSKPSEKKMVQAQITRDDVLKSNNIPYDDLKLYQSTALTDWRDMGNPENDNYDPATYQKLYDIDQAFTKAGVSYKSGAMDKEKYTVKPAKASGSGSRGGYSSDFGTLKAGDFAPHVQQYQSLAQASGSVPHIAVVRPNIVHKIGSSG
ncbi:MAG: hypothetical protein V4563_18050 [Pseudomonadota bacterium]